MKGIVIDKGEECYTLLKKIFKAMKNCQKKYNWLISDYECYPRDEDINKVLSGSLCWITGEELTKLIEKEDFQWIWGVFSAFEKNISRDEILNYSIPSADGNEMVWKKPISIQHPLAKMELIAWDSTLSTIICDDEKIIDDIVQEFPLAEDIEHYMV